jgi:hypothetical protein
MESFLMSEGSCLLHFPVACDDSTLSQKKLLKLGELGTLLLIPSGIFDSGTKCRKD